MKTILHFDVTAEPAGFHLGAAIDEPENVGRLFFAAHAALEVEGDPVDPAQESAARDKFAAFIDGAPATQIALLNIAKAGDAWQVTGSPISVDVLKPADEGKPADGVKPNLMAWLDKKKKLRPKGVAAPGFFARAPRTGDTVDAADATAADLLRASLNWLAPVPQRLGLSRLVTFTQPISETEKSLLVPVPKGTFDAEVDPTAPIDFTIVGDGTDFSVTYQYSPLSEVECRTAALTPYTPDSLGTDDILEPDGWVARDETGGDLHAALKRIEETAATELWTLPAFLDPVFSGEEGEAGPDLTEVMWSESQLVWFARTGIVLTFDTILTALAMPGQEKSSGQVLQYLVAFIETELAGVKQVPSGEVRGTLLASIRRVVGALDFDRLFKLVPEDRRSAIGGLHFALKDAVEAAAAEDGDEPQGKELPLAQKLAAVRDALSELAAVVQEEKIAEAVILGVLKGMDLFAPPAEGIPFTPEEEAYRRGLKSFERLLSGPFNGAEAVRRTFGMLAVDRLATHGAGAAGWSYDLASVTAALEGADLFSARFKLSAAGALDSLVATLPAVELPPDETAEAAGSAKGGFPEHLGQRYKSAVDDLLDKRAANARFRPDSFPRPLPIRITPTVDSEALEKVAEHIQGIGVLVRANGKGADIIGNASLASVHTSGEGAAGVVAKIAVLPMMPALADGRAPVFIEYSGLPLAGAAQAATAPADAEILDEEQRRHKDAAQPIYHIGDAIVPDDPKDIPDDLLPPALAYGYDYGVRAFWIPNSGALPHFLRARKDRPFEAGPFNDAAIFGDPVPYRRRTAISETGLSELGQEKRIGEKQEDVFPLSGDHPRLSLSAFDKGGAFLDLFRNSDGVGALPADTKKIVLKELLASFAAGQNPVLKVYKLTDPQAAKEENEDEIGSIDLWEKPGSTWHQGGDLEIGIADAKQPFWIRLRVTGAEASVSFAEPDAVAGQHAPSRPLPILMIAQTDNKTWRERYTRPTELEIAMPRVSHTDFERWAANSALFARSTGVKGDDPVKTAAALGAALERASLARGLSPRIEQLIDRLPDPAVARMLISVELTDTLDGWSHKPVQQVWNIAAYQDAEFDELPEDEDPNLEERDEAFWKRSFQEMISDIELLDRGGRIRIVVHTGTELKVEKTETEAEGEDEFFFKVTVPAGVAARLTIQPMVSKELIDEAGAEGPRGFHPHMAQLAIGEYDGCYLFAGAAVIVEAMRELPAFDLEAAMKRSTVVTASTARQYAIELAAGADPYEVEGSYWRCFSHADIVTQRWRPSGRPIYNWIDPVSHRQKAAAGRPLENSPVVDIAGFDNLEPFEADAYDRKPDEAEHARIRLSPYPSASRLQLFQWAPPSATAFRHRVEMRSRYAGAMRAPGRQTHALWKKPRDERGGKIYGWTNHAAVLADAAALELTRPQVRALLPLTTRIADALEHEAAPPIVCILAEKPFDQAGLADRIVAEIKTAKKFAFVDPGGEAEASDRQMLGLSRLRREAGPDPRLSYFPVSDDDSLWRTLRVEGPVGLHFDRSDARAPAFSNCAVLLHPSALDGGNPMLEETFFGVSLSRVVEPSWCWTDDKRPAPTADSDAWWVDLTGPFELATPVDTEASTYRSLVRVAAVTGAGEVDAAPDFDSRARIVEVNRNAVYPVPGLDQPEMTRFCAIPSGWSVSLLHQKLDLGRYRISVFGRDRRPAGADVEEKGEVGQPRLLASMEWAAAGKLKARDGAGKPSLEKLRLVRVSSPTFTEWTRTGRDFQIVSAGAAGGEWALNSMSDLSAVLERDGQTAGKRIVLRRKADAAPVRLQSPLYHGQGVEAGSGKAYPLHVQRHAALMVTTPSKALGREVALFECAVPADRWGADILSSKAAGMPLRAAVQLIEYETRAEILTASQDPRIAYGLAHFDLVSIRGRAPATEGTGMRLRLHVRFTNRALEPGEGFALTFHAADRDDLAIIEIAAPAESRVRSLDLRIDVFANDATVWEIKFPRDEASGRIDRVSGELEDASPFAGAARTTSALGLSLRPVHADAETLWCDVSLLYSMFEHADDNVSPDDAFDFDWLFSAPTQAGSVADAASAAELRELTEVQARIVSVGDPIPLSNSS